MVTSGAQGQFVTSLLLGCQDSANNRTQLLCEFLARLGIAPSAAASAANRIQRDGTGAEQDEGEGNGPQHERKFVAARTHETVRPMRLDEGDAHIDQEGEGPAAD